MGRTDDRAARNLVFDRILRLIRRSSSRRSEPAEPIDRRFFGRRLGVVPPQDVRMTLLTEA